jgi:hypothetical protein
VLRIGLTFPTDKSLSWLPSITELLFLKLKIKMIDTCRHPANIMKTIECKRGPWKLLEVETSTYMFQEMVCRHEDNEGSNL